MPSGRIPHTAGTMQCEPSCLVCCPRASFTRRAPWPYAFLIPIQPPVNLPSLLLTPTPRPRPPPTPPPPPSPPPTADAAGPPGETVTTIPYATLADASDDALRRLPL